MTDKIKIIEMEKSEILQNAEWADFSSLKYRMLQLSDWVHLPDSNIKNLKDWVKWRDIVKSIKKCNFSNPAEALETLKKISERMPPFKSDDVLSDVVDLNFIKQKVLTKCKIFFSNQIDYEISMSISNKTLIRERYEESKQYLKTKDLSTCPLLAQTANIRGMPIDEIVKQSINDQQNMYLILLRHNNNLENHIKMISECNSVYDVVEISRKIDKWILTLTLNQRHQ